VACLQLRSAVLAIVTADGIEALTSGRLAAEAGVSVEEAGEHYATASDALYDTYEELAQAVLEDFRSAFGVEQSWRPALQLGGRILLERMAARPAEARFLFIEAPRGDHELQRRRIVARRRLVQLFAAELHGRTDGEDVVPQLQLELLIGAGFQAIAAAVESGDCTELPELEPELVSRAHVFEPVGV
jgi:hypothetical protein